MAGAGYKLFNTGDVLTAAQVNTYLQEQTVMVFADAAARTTALSGVLAEGMITYLKSTDAVEVYNGSAWVNVASDQTPLTTKGDLFTYSTTDARLAVGNNGETLVADSSATTGLSYQANWAAGKNKIINGNFNINQRAFSSTTTSNAYGFDRWSLSASDGTTTYSTQAFTLGTAPVAGYESKNFARLVSTGQTATSAASILVQPIESVRTFAGQTVTVSFWAKAGSGTPSVAAELVQYFGTGGSPSATVTGNIASPAKQAITTSWARYSFTIAVPSISGKTIGSDNNDYLRLNLWTSAGTDFNARTGSLGIQSATIDIWGVQVEAGSVATAFQTATGTLAGELAACQRYYYRINADNQYQPFGIGYNVSTTQSYGMVYFPVSMRTTPTLEATSTASNYSVYTNTRIACSSVPVIDIGSTTETTIKYTVASGLTAGQGMVATANASTAAYLGFNGEL